MRDPHPIAPRRTGGLRELEVIADLRRFVGGPFTGDVCRLALPAG